MWIEVVVVASPLYACGNTDKNKNGTAGSCCSLECSSTREITTVYRLSHHSLFISKSLEISFRFCLVRDGVADFSWCSNTQRCICSVVLSGKNQKFPYCEFGARGIDNSFGAFELFVYIWCRFLLLLLLSSRQSALQTESFPCLTFFSLATRKKKLEIKTIREYPSRSSSIPVCCRRCALHTNRTYKRKHRQSINQQKLQCFFVFLVVFDFPFFFGV